MLITGYLPVCLISLLPQSHPDHSCFFSALLFCGLGETAINNLFAAINLPHISATTLKRRERERDRHCF